MWLHVYSSHYLMSLFPSYSFLQCRTACNIALLYCFSPTAWYKSEREQEEEAVYWDAAVHLRQLTLLYICLWVTGANRWASAQSLCATVCLKRLFSLESCHSFSLVFPVLRLVHSERGIKCRRISTSADLPQSPTTSTGSPSHQHCSRQVTIQAYNGIQNMSCYISINDSCSVAMRAYGLLNLTWYQRKSLMASKISFCPNQLLSLVSINAHGLFHSVNSAISLSGMLVIFKQTVKTS